MSKLIKRTIDLVISLPLLIIFLPLILIIGILIYLMMGRPIFFKQLRPGYMERPFYILKFRTMTLAVDKNGNDLPDSQRKHPLGSFLRKLSLDELPQLFNVAKGELSLVGPRPLLMDYLPLYNSRQARRHTVKPGLTGWAQVNGRNAITWKERFELDIWYVENASPLLDIKILLLTIYKVLKRSDVTTKSDTTMPRFTGTDNE